MRTTAEMASNRIFQRNRLVALDWRLIGAIRTVPYSQVSSAKTLKLSFLAGIDVERILCGGVDECSVLQAVLPGIAFCSLRDEFPGDSVPSGVEKVFRLAQLLLQYMMHSQEKLAEAVDGLKDSNERMNEVYVGDINCPLRSSVLLLWTVCVYAMAVRSLIISPRHGL